MSGFSRRAASLQPRPGFKAQLTTRLEGAAAYARHMRQSRRSGFFGWQRAWAVALPAILVVILVSAGTVGASSNALPDEPLYPVKLATEQARLTFAFSDAGKAKLHTQYAGERSLEIAAMARQGKTEQVATATQRLSVHLERANYAIRKVRVTAPKPQIAVPEATLAPELAAPAPDKDEAGDVERLKEFARGSASGNTAVLEDALKDAPEQTRPALRRAIEISKKSYEETQQEAGTENEDKPSSTEDEDKPTSVTPNQLQPSLQREFENR